MKLGSEILWLSEKDVQSLLSMGDVISAVEGAFLAHGEKRVQMPVKIYLEFDPYGGDLRAMPAYIKGKNALAGVKIVNSNPKNPQKKLPAVSGIMVVNEPKTGLPLAVLAAGNLTSSRTGAAGAVAAKYLARKNSHSVGLIGCGRQAATQLEALRLLFSITHVRVWGKTKREAEEFMKRLPKKGQLDVRYCPAVRDACDADIVVTTTPVRIPLVKSEWIRPGTHVNAIGADAPGKQELDGRLLKRSKVVVDDWGQASHAGEINVPVAKKQFVRKNLYAELGEIVAKKKAGRTNQQEITLFDSTGLALQDVATARLLLKLAHKKGKGQVLKFHG